MGDLFTLVPWIIIGAAVLGALKTVVKMWREQGFSRVALSASGEVTDVREHRRQRHSGGDHGSRTVITYSPVLRFTLPDGRVVDAEAYEEASSAPARGSQVAIRYDPADPTRCRLDGRDASRWGGHVAQLVLAAFVAAVAAFVLGVR